MFGEGGSGTGATILMLVVLVAFWLLISLPEKKRKKAQQQMRSELKVGDEVTMLGGVFGTVCAVKDNSIVIETGADRVRIEYAKWAVQKQGFQEAE